MVVMSEAPVDVGDGFDPPSAVLERLEAFGVEVLAEAMNRPVQARNGDLYLRGLIEQGARKSLEPMVERLGEDADYQSMQQFLADSPWDPALVVKAVAERVAPRIDVEAWVLDDTGFPKDGKDSPGVKRQYSGTLGKTGNCQIGVSVHAVGSEGTVPLGWALYLPEEWCEDAGRWRKRRTPPAASASSRTRAATMLDDTIVLFIWLLPCRRARDSVGLVSPVKEVRAAGHRDKRGNPAMRRRAASLRLATKASVARPPGAGSRSPSSGSLSPIKPLNESLAIQAFCKNSNWRAMFALRQTKRRPRGRLRRRRASLLRRQARTVFAATPKMR